MHRVRSAQRVFLLVAMLVVGQLSAALNVRDFGATGDGETDDTAAIQKALTAAAVAKVTPAVRFPAGTYRVSRPLLVSSLAALHGAPGSVLVAAGNHDLLYVHEARRVRIQGLRFRGGKRHIRISPGEALLGTVTISACTFEESGGFAVECMKLLEPDGDGTLAPYRVGDGGLVAQDEGRGRIAPCPLLLHVDACVFRDCQNAVSGMCETAVVENSTVTTPETMRGGAFRASGRFLLAQVSGLAYPVAGRKQHWLTAIGGAVALRGCTFRSDEPWGLPAVYALQTGGKTASSVVIDGCSFAAAGNEEGCLVYCREMPNLIAVRNSRELSDQPVDILGFARTFTMEGLEERCHYPTSTVPERFRLDLSEGNHGLAANVPKELAPLACPPLPESSAAAFQTTVHDIRPEPAPTPKRSLNLLDFGAKGDGMSDDSVAFKKALRKLRPTDELVVPPGRYRLTQTVRLPPRTTIRGDGWPIFLVARPAKVGFFAKKALALRMSGCVFEGGETALQVTTAPDRHSLVQLSNCSFSDTSGPAVTCLSGAGRVSEPNRSRLRVVSCEFQGCDQALQTNFNQSHMRACALVSKRNASDRPVVDCMGASMVFEGILGIPQLGADREDADPRWLDAYGRLLCRDVRFGPEDGGMCLVRVRQGERGDNEVFIENSSAWCRGNRRRDAMVHCDVVPRAIALRNCVASPEKQVTVSIGPGLEDALSRAVHLSGNVFPARISLPILPGIRH